MKEINLTIPKLEAVTKIPAPENPEDASPNIKGEDYEA